MPLFIFFVNKPLTVLFYFIGLIICILISIINMPVWIFSIFSSIFLMITFSVWYPFILFYCYFLRNNGENIQIQGVHLKSLKRPLEFVFALNVLFIAIAIGITIYLFPHVVVGSFFVLLYSVFSINILEQYILAKLVSIGIKQNVSLKITEINTVYAEIREVLTKKLIN